MLELNTMRSAAALAAPEAGQPVTPAQPGSSDDHARLAAAAVKFEAFFVAQMMKQMRQTTAALADRDSALNNEVNQAPLAMADTAVADSLAAQRAFGIADVLLRQMSASLSATPVAPEAVLRPTSRNLS